MIVTVKNPASRSASPTFRPPWLACAICDAVTLIPDLFSNVRMRVRVHAHVRPRKGDLASQRHRLSHEWPRWRPTATSGALRSVTCASRSVTTKRLQGEVQCTITVQ